MKLSVIIPYVNEYPQVMFTIQSIAQELINRVDFEILAIDNWCKEVGEQTTGPDTHRMQDHGSAAVEATDRLNPWLRYVKYSDKLSHWQAKNFGVSKATGDIFWFCDAHCVIGRDSLYNMFKHYVSRDMNGTMHLPLTYKILESRRLIYKLVCRKDQGELSYSFTGFRVEDEPYEVPCMSNCGVMMSREVYNKLGGWPTELGIYRGGEHFVNFTLSVLGMKKWIYPYGVLFHHGEKRGYHWNYDDGVRNRFIANYMFGGDKWLNSMKNHTKGRKEVLQSIYENVKMSCKEHRDFIKSQQVMSIDEWLDIWLNK